MAAKQAHEQLRECLGVTTVPSNSFFSSVAASPTGEHCCWEESTPSTASYPRLPEMTKQRDKGREHRKAIRQHTACRTRGEGRLQREVTTNLVSFPHLKSDSSSVVEWLIMAQRQSMLELDRARPMHFFTM